MATHFLNCPIRRQIRFIAEPTFGEYARALWGPSWGLCRATPKNRLRYGRCVSKKEYFAAVAAYRREHTISWLKEGGATGAIAAELLAALRNITECAEAGPDGANMDLWIEQARAAIARAKGE